MTARFPFLLKGMATPQRLRWLFADHPIYFITACTYNRRQILAQRRLYTTLLLNFRSPELVEISMRRTLSLSIPLLAEEGWPRHQ